MESSAAARVLSAPCPPNHYPTWYGPPSHHQITNNSHHQGSFLHFPGTAGSGTPVLSPNQANAPMYGLHHQQYSQYHSVANSTTVTPPGMSMHHGFIGNPHHPSTHFPHPAATVGEPSHLGIPAFMLNMERTSEIGLTQINRTRKKRQPYSKTQINNLEQEYQNSNFITRQKREIIARELKLTDRQVKIWFQNRRVKDKKIKQREGKDSQQQHHQTVANGHRENYKSSAMYARHASIPTMARDLQMKAEDLVMHHTPILNRTAMVSTGHEISSI